jgi:hypothetical protein
MNERIREIAKQVPNWNCNGVFLGPYEKSLEKFAELIVRECAEIAFQFSMENKRIHPNIDPTTMPEANQMIYHSTCQAVGYEIREHFGVEE